MKKTLILFRLFNRFHGPDVNTKTLIVYLKPDNTFGYSFYGGWQNSGTGFAISNLQMKESLPMGARNFKTVEEVRDKIVSCLGTGCGTNDIHKIEILNDL